MSKNKARGGGRPKLSDRGSRATSISLDLDIYEALSIVAMTRGQSLSRVINAELRVVLRPRSRINE